MGELGRIRANIFFPLFPDDTDRAKGQMGEPLGETFLWRHFCGEIFVETCLRNKKGQTRAKSGELGRSFR